MIVVPTVLMVRNGMGAPARQASLMKMNCSTSVRPCPPYSVGQPMPSQPSRAHLAHGLEAGRAAGVARRRTPPRPRASSGPRSSRAAPGAAPPAQPCRRRTSTGPLPRKVERVPAVSNTSSDVGGAGSGDGAGGPERASTSSGREPPVEQHLVGVLPGHRRGPIELGGRGGEAGRRRRLGHAVALDDGARAARRCGCAAASRIVRTGARHASRPSARSSHSARGRPAKAQVEGGPQLGPAGLVVLVGQRARREPEHVEEGGEELRLDGADRDLLAVGAAVDVVEGRAGVEQVRAPLVGPEADGAGAEERAP